MDAPQQEPTPRAPRRRPPATWSVALTLLVSGLLLEDASRQIATNPLLALVAMGSVGLLAVNYVLCLARAPAPSGAGARWRWTVLPFARLLVASTWWHPWLLVLRFNHSRADFERVLVDVRSDKAHLGRQSVGTFTVERVERINGVVCFVVGQGLADPVAICFDPSCPGEFWLSRHLGGCWYAREL